LIVFGIEICYAAETAFVSPVLLKIGVPVQYMSMVWGLSPIIGFFAGPLLGSLSDDCNSRLGRRRPFLILHSLGILIGLFLTGYGHLLGNLIHKYTGVNPLVILITILGVILLDFNCDACQSPARAYLIDVCHTDDHALGLSTFTIMAGAGGCIGYILGGIPWAEFSISSTIYNYNSSNTSDGVSPQHGLYQADLAYQHKQILFSCVAVVYVICAIVCITSFKEIPLDILKQKEDKKPESLKYEKSDLKYNKMVESLSENDTFANIDDDIKSLDKFEQVGEESKLTTIKYYIKSIINMPKSLRWLCLTHCFCWMSLLCYSLYFTDFAGEEMFGKWSSFFSNSKTKHKKLKDKKGCFF
jgi:solute carrier family 45 protein 1/2/4